MLILVSIVILLLTPEIMAVIRAVRPAFASLWLCAALSAFISWTLVLFSGLRLPQEIPLLQWNTVPLFGSSPALRVDSYTWPLALAVVSLLVAVIFTATARAPRGNWESWASSCILAALGLVGVLAANPLTLLLAWAAGDLAGLLITFTQVYSSNARQQIVILFSMRAGGVFFLIWAGVAVFQAGGWQDLGRIPIAVSPYLFLAAGLRLGVVPVNLSSLQEIPLRRGLGVSLYLIPAASSLALLVRLANAGVAPALSPVLLGLAALTGLYGGLRWINEPNEWTARPFWLIGLSSFAAASAFTTRPASALAWSLTCLLSGGLIFLAHARHPAVLPLRVLGILALTALPFTPGWNGAAVYLPLEPAWLSILLVMFLFAHGLFLAGACLILFSPGDTLAGVDRWVGVIYSLGLAVLPLAQILASWRALPMASQVHFNGWLGGLLASGLAIFLIFLKRRWGINFGVPPAWERFFSFTWVYHFLGTIYQATRRVVDWMTIFLEGEAGILWALLLLALLISILISPGVGG